MVAVYHRAEEARTAVKMLINHGFEAAQLFVLCTDEKRSEEFRSRLMPSGAPQLNTAPAVTSGAGAALGAGVLGGLGLATGGLAAAAGVAIGAAAGAGIGFLLGSGTYSTDEAHALVERFKPLLDEGAILVVLRPREGKDDEEQLKKAETMFQAASDDTGVRSEVEPTE